ncbi:hypothetical protein D3C86_1587650 [compost metagenome]
MRDRAVGNIRDILLTDAPGEWFTQWARKPGEATAAGARWVVEHSDVLLVLVDSAGLADADKLPQTRRATRDLIERVGAEAKDRSVIVVWTKEDIEIPEATHDGLARACGEFLSNAAMLKTTVGIPDTIATCFAHAFRHAERVSTLGGAVEPQLSRDPFLAFRGIHVNS